MEKIIRELNSDVLESMGFHFDGAYWVSTNIPLRLQSNGDGTYLVSIGDPHAGLPIGLGEQPSIRSNHQLLLLMVNLSQPYIQSRLQNYGNIPDPAILLKLINGIINEYLNLPSSSPIKLRALPAPQGIQIEPDNEETMTLMSGIMCEFTVQYDDGEELIYVDPTAMSYDYIKRLYPDREPIKVYVSNEDSKVPFFGVGIRRVNINLE